MPGDVQDIAKDWTSFDEAKRTRLLGQMTPEMKSNLRKALESRQSAPASKGPAPKVGTLADTLTNIGEHAKNLVMGPIQAISAPPDSPEEAAIAGMYSPVGLGAYRMFGKPSVEGITSAVEQGKKGNVLSKDEYDAQGNYTPSAFSSVVDAIPLVGPWARGIETEAHQKGMAPALAGFGTDVVGGELMGEAPGLGKKVVGGLARKGSQFMLGAGEDLTRRAVEDVNKRAKENVAKNEDLRKQFKDRLDVSMHKDQGVVTEHEAKVQGKLDEHRKAQQEHQEKLRAMAERNQQRVHQNQAAEAERVRKNQEKTDKYHADVRKIEDDNKAAIAEHEAAKKKAQSDWDELNKAHGQGQEAIASRDVMERQVQDDLKALERKVNAEGNAKYNNLRKKMADTFLPSEEAATAVNKAYDLVRGTPETIKEFESIKALSDLKKAAEGPPRPIKWNDLQGYLEELRAKKAGGGLKPDVYQAVKQMEQYIEDEMGKLAHENGQAAEWSDAQASWRKYKETFHDSGSPVAKAIDARTSDVAARGFMGRKVMTEDPALNQLRVYDPDLYNKIHRLREVSGEATVGEKAKVPGALAEVEPPKLKSTTDVKPPQLDETPIPWDKGFEDTSSLLPPEFTEHAPAPKAAAPMNTERGTYFEEPTLDAPELKRERVRRTARGFSEPRHGDVHTAVTSPMGVGPIFIQKMLANFMDRPAWLEFFAKPSAGDIEALEGLSDRPGPASDPLSPRAKARAKIEEFLANEKINRARLDPRIKQFLATGSRVTGAEQQARDAARRLREKEQEEHGVVLTP